MRRRCCGLLSAALAASAIACGGAAPRDSSPSSDQLAKLAKAAPPKTAFDRGAAQVQVWQLSGPLPDAVDSSPADPASPWNKLLVEALAAKSTTATAPLAMECAARQVAAFVVEKQARPPDALVRFIASRCGVPSGSFSLSYRTGEIPALTSDAGVFEEWSADVKLDVSHLADGDSRRVAGIGVARNSKRAAVAIVVAGQDVELEKVPFVPIGGKVVLKGKLVDPAHTIRALVTRGRFAYETCSRDVEVRLPAFSIECPVASDDPAARVELVSFQEGRDLGDGVLGLTVFPSGNPPAAWSHPIESGALLAPKTPATPALLESINAARKEAGMPAVRLSEAQSRAASELAGPYFASSVGALAPTVGDKAAMDMLAGWNVEGIVREGHFAARWIFGRSPGALIDRTLESPFGRAALLDPHASLLAVGTLPDDDILATVFGTYSLLDGSGKTDYSGEIRSRLMKLRSDGGRSAPQIARGLDAVLAAGVARIESGVVPREALNQVTKKSMDVIASGRVAAWFVSAASVDMLEFPPDLLLRPSLKLGVGVAKYRGKGSPWTRLGILFVAIEDSAALGDAARQGDARPTGP